MKGLAAQELRVGGAEGTGIPGWSVLEPLSVGQSIHSISEGRKVVENHKYFNILTRCLKIVRDIFVKFCTQFHTTNI